MAEDEYDWPEPIPFWRLNDVGDEAVVYRSLRQRFPEEYANLLESLAAADPLDVVYQGYEDEYSDVVAEILVLLAPVNGDIRKLTMDELHAIVRLGISRRFGEPPDEARLRRAVESIAERARTDTK